MPVAAPIVAYFALTGVAAFVATTIIYAAEMLALNAIMRALSPRAPKPADLPRTQSISDTLAHGKILFGAVCVGGANIIPPISTTGTDPTDGKTYAGNWTHRGLVFAQHEVDSYGPLRYEQAYIDQSQIAPVNNTLDAGLVLASGNVWDSVLHLARYTMARLYRGTSTDTADYILTQADPVAFTSSFRSRGVACGFFTFAFGDWFQGGVPPISVCINGMRVYDPRKDATNGGLGTHRYATPSTWEWSCNPTLCAAALIIFDRELGGGGYDPAADIDWPLVAAAANISDASVDTAPTVANLISQGTSPIAVSGNTLTKNGGANAWDSSARSTVSIKAGRISWRVGGALHQMMGGLSVSPSASASFNFDYAWNAAAASGWRIYEGGTQILIASAAAVSVNDIAEILYDGTNILYLLNGKIYRQVKVDFVGESLFFDSSMFTANGVMVVNQQRRYTCNLELDGAALFEDNLGYLIDASFGRAIDRDGKWRLYAGAWDSPTDPIAQADWIGPIQIQAVTPRREGRWNGVRTFYYDPLRNWQRVECQARTNAAYKAQDGGERIWQELDRPAIGDESTAQRMGEFTLRQSRNGIKVTGTLPPRFQYLSIWQTVTIDYPDLGWSGKSFRLMGYTLNPDGSVGVSFTEEQASDWIDMASSEFGKPDQHLIPQTNEQAPRTITSLVATPFSEGITFTIGIPKLLPGDVVVMYEFLSQSTDPNQAGRVLIATTKSDTITLKKADNTSRYYRVWIQNSQAHFSLPYPPSGSNAVEGHAGSQGWVGRGVHLSVTSAYKVDTGINADNVWDSDLISILGYLQCYLRFKTNPVPGGNVMMGLSENPSSQTSYVGVQYAWYNNVADWRIYESGVQMQIVAGAVLAQDVATITYDGANIRYYLNGILIRTVSAPGKTLFMDSSFYGFNDSAVNSVEFAPMPSGTLPLVDTPQIGDAAATDLYGSYNGSDLVVGGAATQTIAALTVPAHDAEHTVILTAMFEGSRTGGGGNAFVWLDSLTSGAFSTGMQICLGVVVDHCAQQFQFSIAAGAPAQTYRIRADVPAGTTIDFLALSFQAEVIKK